jgi:hypothetical protein
LVFLLTKNWVGLPTFWAIFSQTHLVTLVHTHERAISRCSFERRGEEGGKSWLCSAFLVGRVVRQRISGKRIFSFKCRSG